MSGSIPFFHRRDSSEKGAQDGAHGDADKPANAKAEDDRSRREAEAKQKEDRRADAEREERHRKEVAVGRSEGGGSVPGEAPSRQGSYGAARHAAKTIAGIWKEFNEDDGDAPADRAATSGDDTAAVASAAGAGGASSGADEARKEAPPEAVARIVAYSDSDSDEPLPFQVQHRKHARRTLISDPAAAKDAGAPSLSEPAAAGALARSRRWWRWRRDPDSGASGGAAPGDVLQACHGLLPDQAPHGSCCPYKRGESSGQAGVRRVASAAKRLGARQAQGLRDGSTWALLLKVLLVALLRRFQPKAVTSFELLSLALPLPDALSGWMSGPPVSDSFPEALRGGVRDMGSFAAPLLLLRALRTCRHLLLRRGGRDRAKPVRRSISESVMMLRGVVEDKGELAPGDADAPLAGAPEYAVHLASHRAALHEPELAELGRMLAAAGVALPPERFDATHAELLRYAATFGLLEASCPEECAVALETAASAVADTLAWRQKRRFLSPQQLATWDHYMQWQGSDAEGTPVLLVHLARLCNDCSSAEQAQLAADALISQVELGVRVRLDNEAGPDQVVVVLLAAGANPLQVTRQVTLYRETALTLNKHYPGRLKRLFLVGLPPDLAWVLDTQLRPLLHPTTRAAIRACPPGDPALPALPGLGSLSEEDPPESPATPASLQNGTDTESEVYATPRSALVLPDVPELASSAAPPPPPPVRTALGGIEGPPPPTDVGPEGGSFSRRSKRVFIPDSPATPVTETRTPRSLRRIPSGRSVLGEPSPRLRPSLKRASYSGLSRTCAPIAEQAGPGLRRSLSFPRSHALLRTMTLGEILAGAGRPMLDLEQDLEVAAASLLPDLAPPHPPTAAQEAPAAAAADDLPVVQRQDSTAPDPAASKSVCRNM